MAYTSYDHDKLDTADEMKIERRISFNSDRADISQLAALPLERLQIIRGESAAAEQAVFESLQQAAGAWEHQAAVTMLIDKAIDYVKFPAVKHTANQWEKDSDSGDWQSISNMVYKMSYHVYENTRYDSQTKKSVPYAWEVTWSVRTNAPGHYSDSIGGQRNKRYTDKTEAEKYLAGRIKAYAHLFTEISPPIPQEYANTFRVNGQLLPGYTLEHEEFTPPERAAEISGVSVVDQKLYELLRKEQENMNEPLNIKLSTREQHEAGSVEGAWLKLPAAAEQLNAALARIGAQGRDFVISGFESPVAAVSRISLENVQKAGIDELNFLAARLEMFTQEHTDKLNAASQIMGEKGEDVHHLIEYTFCPDFYELQTDVMTHAKLGTYIFEYSGLIQIPDGWAAAIDREKLGELAATQEKGVFTEYGYIVESGTAGTEWYSINKDDIPEAYRITPPDIEQDAITTRTAATITAKLPEKVQTAAFVPIVLTAENPRDRMKEITDKLEAGIKGIFDSEKYKDYLQTLSKFHNYSFNNCILIAMQKPDASHVAGFNDWRDKFKRPVMKGEKGIKILAPAPFKTKKLVDAVNADGKPVFENGRRKKEEKEITVPAFKIVSVFDVSQTDGEPLPQIGVDELTGNVDRYKELFAALEKTSPVPVGFEALSPGTKGVYYQEDKRIAVNEGMSELQNLKTLVHEIAHARLHDIDKNAPKDTLRPDKDTREVQAESVAYAVCLHYGLDTSGYSFGYVAEWSGGKELDILKASLDTIRKEADAIITEVDKHFAVLAQDKEQTAEQTTPTEQPAPEQTEPQGDSFTIYQLKDSDETRNIRFVELAALTTAGLAVAVANYDRIYSAPLESNTTLDDIYMNFNIDHPEGFTGHSLSVSDVIVMNRDGKETAHYVDSVGFQELPDFLTPKEQAREKPVQPIDLKAVADFMQKQYDYAKGADPNSQAAVATVSIITRRLNAANERIPDNQPQLKALISNAAQSTNLSILQERMNAMHSDFIQHYSTAVQMTIDTSGKAEPQKPAPAASVKQNDAPPAPKAPAYGENVAAIEAQVKAGEVINLSDLSDAIKKTLSKKIRWRHRRHNPHSRARPGRPGRLQKQKPPSRKNRLSARNWRRVKNNLPPRKPRPQRRKIKMPDWRHNNELFYFYR